MTDRRHLFFRWSLLSLSFSSLGARGTGWRASLDRANCRFSACVPSVALSASVFVGIGQLIYVFT